VRSKSNCDPGCKCKGNALEFSVTPTISKQKAVLSTEQLGLQLPFGFEGIYWFSITAKVKIKYQEQDCFRVLGRPNPK
jgi:hypothetical protein